MMSKTSRPLVFRSCIADEACTRTLLLLHLLLVAWLQYNKHLIIHAIISQDCPPIMDLVQTKYAANCAILSLGFPLPRPLPLPRPPLPPRPPPRPLLLRLAIA